MKKILPLAAAFIFFASGAFAQDAMRELRTLPNEPKETFFHLVIENDSLGGGTDENYTSGVRLSYMDLDAEIPDIAHVIADYIPTFDITENSGVYYSLGHNIFTPNDITQTTLDVNDRPYAAFAYGSIGLVTVNTNHVDDVEATLGIVGPWAFGEEIQTFVHEYVTPSSPEPEGWDHQLDNEPALMLAWQRRWPEYVSRDFFGLNFGVEPNLGVTLGNVYTYGNVGINFRLGPETEKWQDGPLRVRPAIPGTGYFEIPQDNPFSWYLFAGLDGRLMARNIFLDGNTFSNSHSVHKKPLVGDANIGLAVTYDQLRISYTLNYRTKEFNGQDSDNQVFGVVGVSYRF